LAFTSEWRLAAGLADRDRQALRTLDVVDDGRALDARQDVAGEQHQLAIRIDDVAAQGDHAQAVAVAVERQAQLRLGGVHRADQVGQVLRLGRIRMMVREVAVDTAVQLDHLAAEGPQDARGGGAGDAVARVDHDLHRTRELAVARDAVRVFGEDVHLRGAPRAGHVGLGFHQPAQLLDVLAVDRAAGQHHLEAVVVLRVVAAGDLDARGAAVPGARRGHVIEHRRGDGADVDHVQPGRCQALDQGRHQRRPGDPSVTPHRHRLLAQPHGFGAEGSAQMFRERFVERLVDDAADVVGLEGRCFDVHGISLRLREDGGRF
jgi:hypothetical protein